MPIVTEVAGYVKYGDIIDGVTMQESLDEITGLSRKTIIESKDADSRPRITLKDADGNTVKLPAGSARRATSCRSARTSTSTTATTSRPATSSRRSRARPRRRRTSPAVCRASRAVRGAQAEGPRRHLRDRRHVHFGKDTKGKRKVLVVPEVGDPAST
jgi:DNA-directed RNA polymerase subunit beta'